MINYQDVRDFTRSASYRGITITVHLRCRAEDSYDIRAIFTNGEGLEGQISAGPYPLEEAFEAAFEIARLEVDRQTNDREE